MDNKFDKRWTVYWSYKILGETHRRSHTNVVGSQNEAEQLFHGLKNLAKSCCEFKAKIVKEEVIEVA